MIRRSAASNKRYSSDVENETSDFDTHSSTEYGKPFGKERSPCSAPALHMLGFIFPFIFFSHLCFCAGFFVSTPAHSAAVYRNLYIDIVAAKHYPIKINEFFGLQSAQCVRVCLGLRAVRAGTLNPSLFCLFLLFALFARCCWSSVDSA